MFEESKTSTVSTMGVEVPVNALGDTVLALAIRTYVSPTATDSRNLADGHTDHHQDHYKDHADCWTCAASGL